MSDQKSVRIKIEPASLFRRKMQLMLIGFIPFLVTAFAGILKLMNERGDFPRMMYKILPFTGFICLLVIGAAIALHFFYRSTLTFSKTPKGELQVNIKNFNDKNELFKFGEWSTIALYDREYFKWGTYQKNLYLTLYCNNEPFCMFRHKTSAAESPPEGFMEAMRPGNTWGVPLFFSPETVRIHRIVEQNGKLKKQDVNYYSRH